MENDHARVRLMSVPAIFQTYDEQYGADNKNSIQNKLKDKKKIICDIESVVPNGNGVATVRFTKRLVDTYTNQEEMRGTLGEPRSDTNTTRRIRWKSRSV